MLESQTVDFIPHEKLEIPVELVWFRIVLSNLPIDFESFNVILELFAPALRKIFGGVHP